MTELGSVRFVKRIVVGSDDPAQPRPESANREAMDLLNRCLSGVPKGVLLGVERQSASTRVHGQDVTVQWLCYHVGFARRPDWLED